MLLLGAVIDDALDLAVNSISRVRKKGHVQSGTNDLAHFGIER